VTDQAHPRFDLAAVLGAVPAGLAVYDDRRRLMFVNPAFFRTLGLPPGLFHPGTSLEDVTRVVAHHGIFGPGDPEALAAAMLANDDRTARRYSRRRSDGGTYDAYYVPLAQGHAVSVTDTTQVTALRDGAEQATRRVEQAMAHLRVGLAVFGPDRTLGLHNRRFLELLGLDLAPPGPGTAFGDVLRAAAEGPGFAGAEGSRFLTSQRAQDRSRPGTASWRKAENEVIELQSDPLASGGWTMTVLDISAQAEAEEEVRRRAALLHSVIAHMPSGVAVYDSTHHLALTNAAYRTVMHGAAGVVGEHDSDLVRRQAELGEFGPGDPVTLWQERMVILSNWHTGVHRRQRPTGQTIETRNAPLPDGGIVRVMTDVSESVAAAAQRALHTEQMATMLSHIRHGIVLWDKDQRMVAANSVATDLLGAEPGLLAPGTTLEETIRAAAKRGNLGPDEAGHTLADTLRYRDRTKSHLDQRVTVRGQVLEVRSDPAPHGGFVTTYTDVTAIRQAEVALTEAKAAAEQANLAKSSFLAAMSEELRRPLADMIEQAAAIEQQGGASPALTGALRKAGYRLLARLDGILDVARLEAGRFDLDDELIATGPLLRDALAEADVAAAAAEITLNATVASPEPVVQGDRRRLLQVLGHVIRHSLATTPVGGTVSMVVATGPRGLHLTLTAPGAIVDPARIGTAFDPFHPAGSATEPEAALRLGLYASRIVMQAHGGGLTFSQATGGGTVTVVTLPPRRVHVSVASSTQDWSATSRSNKVLS